MRIFLASILAIGICGCTKVTKDPEPAAQKSEQEQSKKPSGRMPGGVAGMILPGEEEPRGARNQNQNNTPPQPGPEDDKTIPNVEARLVEWPKAKQQLPGLEVVENKVQGSDPISVAASAYVSLSSKAESLNFQHQLNLMKEINEGRPIGFKEFQDLAKKLNIKFQNQPAYRYYGYDTKTGGIVVLEDKAEKKRIYKEKGIPYDE